MKKTSILIATLMLAGAAAAKAPDTAAGAKQGQADQQLAKKGGKKAAKAPKKA